MSLELNDRKRRVTNRVPMLLFVSAAAPTGVLVVVPMVPSGHLARWNSFVMVWNVEGAPEDSMSTLEVSGLDFFAAAVKVELAVSVMKHPKVLNAKEVKVGQVANVVMAKIWHEKSRVIENLSLRMEAEDD
jgi:hypothetical protein